MKSAISVLLFLLVLTSCAQSKSKPITEFSQNDIKTGMLVDVRTPEEFKSGHIENAKNINVYDADFANQFEGVSKDETIYVYCKMGGRSAKAAEQLTSMGYANVIDLTGGYDAFVKK